jgi:hypothetical protein
MRVGESNGPANWTTVGLSCILHRPCSPACNQALGAGIEQDSSRDGATSEQMAASLKPVFTNDEARLDGIVAQFTRHAIRNEAGFNLSAPFNHSLNGRNPLIVENASIDER